MPHRWSELSTPLLADACVRQRSGRSERLDAVLESATRVAEVERDQARHVAAGETLRAQLDFSAFLRGRDADPDLTFRRHLRAIGGAIEE